MESKEIIEIFLAMHYVDQQELLEELAAIANMEVISKERLKLLEDSFNNHSG